MIKKITIKKILKKKNKTPIACLTAYSKNIAEIADRYCDIILVGDSLGMVLYGMKTTRDMTIDTMLLHAKTVKKSTKKSLVVFDMPYKTYRDKFTAYKNAKRVIKFTKCDAIKLEGDKRIAKTIQYLVRKGIPVMGHVGLTPQSFHQMSGYKIQGKTPEDAQKIIDDALAVERAGAFSVVLECIPENLAQKITAKLSIPTIGIGSGNMCDGQIQVFHDVVGLSKKPTPKHALKQTNTYATMFEAVNTYKSLVEK